MAERAGVLVVLCLFLMAGAIMTEVFLQTPGPQRAGREERAATPISPVKTILITNTGFSPATVSIPAGSSVAFVNEDTRMHSIFSFNDTPASFATAPLVFGARQAIVLAKPGTYPYYCEIHPFMNGTIIVMP